MPLVDARRHRLVLVGHGDRWDPDDRCVSHAHMRASKPGSTCGRSHQCHDLREEEADFRLRQQQRHDWSCLDVSLLTAGSLQQIIGVVEAPNACKQNGDKLLCSDSPNASCNNLCNSIELHARFSNGLIFLAFYSRHQRSFTTHQQPTELTHSTRPRKTVRWRSCSVCLRLALGVQHVSQWSQPRYSVFRRSCSSTLLKRCPRPTWSLSPKHAETCANWSNLYSTVQFEWNGRTEAPNPPRTLSKKCPGEA